MPGKKTSNLPKIVESTKVLIAPGHRKFASIEIDVGKSGKERPRPVEKPGKPGKKGK